jgi:hypothetical protein
MNLRHAISGGLLALACLAAAAQDRVVYHINDAETQALAT